MKKSRELKFLLEYLPIIAFLMKFGGEFSFKELEETFSKHYILRFINSGHANRFLEKKNGRYRLNIELPKNLTFSIDKEINENALLVKNGIQILVE